MSQGRRVGLLCVGAAACMLAFPAAGRAAVTVGESTATPGNTTPFGCGSVSACTLAQLQHPTQPLVAPFDGVIVRWRARAALANTPFRVRVLRPSGAAFTGAGAGPQTTVIPGGERVFGAQIPVRAGDYVGFDLAPGAGPPSVERRTVTGASWGLWSPTLGDGEMPPRTPDGAFNNQALLFNADIEPDCDHDGFGDESQDFDKLSCDPPPCLGKAPTIVGTLGADVISGTPGDDVILTSNGDDKVLAGGGRDIVCGGKHKDRLFGGAGRDRLLGELGKDVLLGEGGRDVLKGLGGRDKCKGGPGRDRGSSCERARSVERNRRRP